MEHPFCQAMSPESLSGETRVSYTDDPISIDSTLAIPVPKRVKHGPLKRK
jgi:hypothetical protein